MKTRAEEKKLELPTPKTWKAEDGAVCLRCCVAKLQRVQKLGSTDAGAELVLSDQLVCQDCGWKHTLVATRNHGIQLARVRR